MADLARAEELVQTMDRDAAFRTEVEGASTVAAKHALLESRGFRDVSIEDMKAYVESKGGKLVTQDGGRELSDQELAAVAGGALSEQDQIAMTATIGVIGGIGVAAGAAAAAA